ncbi:MAG TPA: pentapeptide repeat-containing protein, partial [Steroidobacteraceae bacterium]|nr:pentapeptide repeat-containing protein [Steroidobacteraceae bacterium]
TALFAVGLGLEWPVSLHAGLLQHFGDWSPGFVTDGALLLTLNAILRRQERARTLARIGGLSHEFALEAVRHAREAGWLTNGALRRQRLGKAMLARADLSEADLRCSDLPQANLTEVDLQHADLRGACMHGANLRGADLRWCRLDGADLRWADLRGALLDGASLDGIDARFAAVDARQTDYPELSGSIAGGFVTAEQIAKLRMTLALIAARGTPPVESFYRRLFELAPEIRPLFRDDLPSQSRKFLESLKLIVAGLESPERHIAVLQRLGTRHATYGVQERHYAAVGDALLGMLAETLGREFTPEVANAWRRTYEMIASVMMDAARPDGATARTAGTGSQAPSDLRRTANRRSGRFGNP